MPERASKLADRVQHGLSHLAQIVERAPIPHLHQPQIKEPFFDPDQTSSSNSIVEIAAGEEDYLELSIAELHELDLFPHGFLHTDRESLDEFESRRLGETQSSVAFEETQRLLELNPDDLSPLLAEARAEHLMRLGAYTADNQRRIEKERQWLENFSKKIPIEWGTEDVKEGNKIKKRLGTRNIESIISAFTKAQKKGIILSPTLVDAGVFHPNYDVFRIAVRTQVLNVNQLVCALQRVHSFPKYLPEPVPRLAPKGYIQETRNWQDQLISVQRDLGISETTINEALTIAQQAIP